MPGKCIRERVSKPLVATSKGGANGLPPTKHENVLRFWLQPNHQNPVEYFRITANGSIS